MMLYTDSAKNNWQEILKSRKIKGYAILHDKDVQEDGTPKKPHYHILIRYDNPTAESTVQKLAKEIGTANGKVISVADYKGYAEYLIHKNNPEKTQYTIEEVESYGGLNYKTLIKDDGDSKRRAEETLKEILRYCRQNGIYSYSELVDLALEESNEWFRLISGRYMRCVINYLKSMYWTDSESARVNITI